MDFWEDLSGGVKALIVVTILLVIGTFAFRGSSSPSEADLRAHEASRNVANQ